MLRHLVVVVLLSFRRIVFILNILKSYFFGRYNKVLLGEKLMKFPAPLLMNTIHFSMQAIISTVLVHFCWGTKTSQQMSWRDYFARGKLVLLLCNES